MRCWWPDVQGLQQQVEAGTGQESRCSGGAPHSPCSHVHARPGPTPQPLNPSSAQELFEHLLDERTLWFPESEVPFTHEFFKGNHPRPLGWMYQQVG